MKRPLHVLFLCTGNSARSILAEALLTKHGGGRFRALSAGSRPTGRVHPMALRVLEAHEHPTSALRSKSWDEFAGPRAPTLDFVFTVCDNAAGETCPLWPGGPIRAHWGIADPAAVEAPEDRQRAAFEQAYRRLERRVEAFLALDLQGGDPATLQRRLRAIGEADAHGEESS